MYFSERLFYMTRGIIWNVIEDLYSGVNQVFLTSKTYTLHNAFDVNMTPKCIMHWCQHFLVLTFFFCCHEIL